MEPSPKARWMHEKTVTHEPRRKEKKKWKNLNQAIFESWMHERLDARTKKEKTRKRKLKEKEKKSNQKTAHDVSQVRGANERQQLKEVEVVGVEVKHELRQRQQRLRPDARGLRELVKCRLANAEGQGYGQPDGED
jgi:hypothetical protein